MTRARLQTSYKVFVPRLTEWVPSSCMGYFCLRPTSRSWRRNIAISSLLLMNIFDDALTCYCTINLFFTLLCCLTNRSTRRQNWARCQIWGSSPVLRTENSVYELRGSFKWKARWFASNGHVRIPNYLLVFVYVDDILKECDKNLFVFGERRSIDLLALPPHSFLCHL